MQTTDDSAQGLNARCATAVLSNPHVEAGLNSTAVLHGAMSELYAAGAATGTNGGAEDAATVVLPLKTLRRWRRHVARANKALAAHARDAFVREDRLSVELAMLRIAARNDLLDRDAHIAHLLDRIRMYDCVSTTASAPAPASASASTDPSADAGVGVGADTSASTSTPRDRRAVDMDAVVDRAIASVQRVDAALATLSPVGSVSLHGTPLISHLLRNPEIATAANAAAALEAERAAGEAAEPAASAAPTSSAADASGEGALAGPHA